MVLFWLNSCVMFVFRLYSIFSQLVSRYHTYRSFRKYYIYTYIYIYIHTHRKNTIQVLSVWSFSCSPTTHLKRRHILYLISFWKRRNDSQQAIASSETVRLTTIKTTTEPKLRSSGIKTQFMKTCACQNTQSSGIEYYSALTHSYENRKSSKLLQNIR